MPSPRGPLATRVGCAAAVILTTLAIGLSPGRVEAKRQEPGLRLAGQLTHFYNDAFVLQGRDRWRTGGVATSLFLDGPERTYEVRSRLEIITPWNSRDQRRTDRPATGVYSLGLLVHEEAGATKLTYGLFLVRTSSELLGLQEAIHEVAGQEGYWHSERQAPTVDDRSYLSASAELSREFPVTGSIVARPYVSAELGFDTHVRAGVEAVIGASGFPRLASRDVVSGFAMPANLRRGERPGSALDFQLYLGADMSVGHTKYLFEGSGAEPTHVRNRIRVGGQVTYRKLKLFYGVTRLSKEFVGQKEAQVEGVLSVSIGL